jgi:hypothetical protein
MLLVIRFDLVELLENLFIGFFQTFEVFKTSKVPISDFILQTFSQVLP